MKSQDQTFMQKALDLAAKGRGAVEPNPMVGCVIVKNGRVLAKGFHRKFGGAHAEIEALQKSKFSAKGATLYVTLEPCHHHGKTPPCVDAVIRAGVKRVVIAMKDPNELTCGKSIQKLRRHGIEVTVGVCQKEASHLNRFFVHAMTHKRPFVMMKIAQSLNGKISASRNTQTWLTGKAAGRYVHGLRASVDAILVGRHTIEIDDPQLTVRAVKTKKQPTRVILDSQLKLTQNHKIFQDGVTVILVCTLPPDHARVRALQNKGVTVLCCPKARSSSRPNLKPLLQQLFELGIHSILVEGGSEVFSSFAQSGCVDEWHWITAPILLPDSGVPALKLGFCAKLTVTSVAQLGMDMVVVCS